MPVRVQGITETGIVTSLLLLTVHVAELQNIPKCDTSPSTTFHTLQLLCVNSIQSVQQP
jgi:hypothetical protein